MSRQQILAIIIAVAILSILVTVIIVNGVYASGGIDEYIVGIFKAVIGRTAIQ